MRIVHLKFIPWLGSGMNNLTKRACFMRNLMFCGRSKMLVPWNVTRVFLLFARLILKTEAPRFSETLVTASRRLATPQPKFSLAPLWAPQISQCALTIIIILRLISVECCDALKPLEWSHVLNLMLSSAEKSILACNRKRKTSLNVKSVLEVYLCMCWI